MPFLILSSMLVFQLSSFMIWSYSNTAPVNISTSPASSASIRIWMNFASRVEENVVSREEYFVRLRFAVIGS